MDAVIRSNIALIVSGSSLVLSGVGFALNQFRDRPRLKVSSTLYHDDDGNPYKIGVTVVNKGRRPVILAMVGGNCRNGGWGGSDFISNGIRLGENEHHQFEIDKEGVVAMDRYGGPDEPYDLMWVQDTLGNRHKIPNSHEHIAQIHP